MILQKYYWRSVHVADGQTHIFQPASPTGLYIATEVFKLEGGEKVTLIKGLL